MPEIIYLNIFAVFFRRSKEMALFILIIDIVKFIKKNFHNVLDQCYNIPWSWCYITYTRT